MGRELRCAARMARVGGGLRICLCFTGCGGARSSDNWAMTAPIQSWADVAPRLVEVAAGRATADLVIRNVRLVNVQSREVLDGWEVAVVAGRFAYVGPDAGTASRRPPRLWMLAGPT